MSESQAVSFTVKKSTVHNDLHTIVCKNAQERPKRRWRVHYSITREDRHIEDIFADTYTAAYLAFMGKYHDYYIVHIEEIKDGEI